LQQMIGGEIAAVIARENVGYTCYLPIRERFAPHGLA